MHVEHSCRITRNRSEVICLPIAVVTFKLNRYVVVYSNRSDCPLRVNFKVVWWSSLAATPCGVVRSVVGTEALSRPGDATVGYVRVKVFIKGY